MMKQETRFYKNKQNKVEEKINKGLERCKLGDLDVLRVTEENKSPNLLAFCPFFGVAQKVTYARAPLNYAALLRSLKTDQNPAHFGGFIFFRNPKC